MDNVRTDKDKTGKQFVRDTWGQLEYVKILAENFLETT